MFCKRIQQYQYCFLQSQYQTFQDLNRLLKDGSNFIFINLEFHEDQKLLLVRLVFISNRQLREKGIENFANFGRQIYSRILQFNNVIYILQIFWHLYTIIVQSAEQRKALAIQLLQYVKEILQKIIYDEKDWYEEGDLLLSLQQEQLKQKSSQAINLLHISIGKQLSLNTKKQLKKSYLVEIQDINIYIQSSDPLRFFKKRLKNASKPI
ncbi:unnamed protein product [Paramecium primaurelia]|uniref:Uncharacterized protein n=1 Tax=Paramecium primaurelia TaxID=5886 RepID=A0A8S1NQQ3_PARPR|nr:unnamed protein product [Paramecium primaurelia]